MSGRAASVRDAPRDKPAANADRKFKTALDETRMLMLGSQILFGFQFNGLFQDAFDTLSPAAQRLDSAALLLMTLTVALIIVPSTLHRISYAGHVGPALIGATNRASGIALLPFAFGLTLDVYLVMRRVFGSVVGFTAGALFLLLSLMFWYGFEIRGLKKSFLESSMPHRAVKTTPLSTRVDHMLTEARIILPGTQALLGFQLISMMTKTFDALPAASKAVHGAALSCIALALILLIAPAAFHRIKYHGQDSEEFYRTGSRLVTAALFPFAFGISGDIYVAMQKIWAQTGIGIGAAAGTLALLLTLWYVRPFSLRRSAG